MTTQKEIDGLQEILISIKRENEVYMNYPSLVADVLETTNSTICYIEGEIKRLEGLVY